MRAILIDPFKRAISEIDIDPSLDNLYSTLNVETITVVGWDKGNALILDDDGLLKEKADMEYFWVKGSDQPFAGRGLILGDQYGENRPATVALEGVEKVVEWVDKEDIDPDAYTGWTMMFF